MTIHNRYRLRIDHQIVGYMRTIGRSVFFSKDESSWSGTSIEFNQKDACTGWKDINSKMVYAQDILTWSDGNLNHVFQIELDSILQSFYAVRLDTNEIETCMLNEHGFAKSVKRLSFSFVQPI